MARPAVSSPEVCPTPALRSAPRAAPRRRTGRCRTNLNMKRRSPRWRERLDMAACRLREEHSHRPHCGDSLTFAHTDPTAPNGSTLPARHRLKLERRGELEQHTEQQHTNGAPGVSPGRESIPVTREDCAMQARRARPRRPRTDDQADRAESTRHIDHNRYPHGRPRNSVHCREPTAPGPVHSIRMRRSGEDQPHGPHLSAASHATVSKSNHMQPAFRVPAALPQFPREPPVAVRPSASDRPLSLVLPRIRRSPCDAAVPRSSKVARAAWNKWRGPARSAGRRPFMPRKALVTARAALRFARQAADECRVAELTDERHGRSRQRAADDQRPRGRSHPRSTCRD